MVAVSSVIKRFVWLVQRLKIIAFAGYLWLVDYKILQSLIINYPYQHIITLKSIKNKIKYNNYQYNMINKNILFIYKKIQISWKL